MPADEDGDGQPSFWDLVEELGVVVTIPTFLIIVLQVTGSIYPECISDTSQQKLREYSHMQGVRRCWHGV